MPDGVSGLLSRWIKSRRHRRALRWLRPGMTILDVGCGFGELCGALPDGIRYAGIEREPAFTEHCRRTYPDRTFLAGDFLNLLPDLPHELDAILLLAVLEHTPRPESFLAASAVLLKPGGLLLITVPAPGSGPWHTLGSRLGLLSAWADRDHQALPESDRILAMAEAEGFRLVREERFLVRLNRFFAFSLVRPRPSGDADLV